MMIVRGKHFLFGDVCDFCLDGDVIREIRPPSREAPTIDCTDDWVAPGLIDLQVNGYEGLNFCSGSVTPEDVEAAAVQLVNAGVTAFCPTVTTNSSDVMEAGLRAVAGACASGGVAAERILGIHLEGPYISPIDGPRGAHPAEYVRSPEWAELTHWQTVAGGRICMVTVAPELPGALDFIARASAAGVVVAIGHHMATREQINAAVAAGAVLCTHLGNGVNSELPRHPNLLWEQLANDALSASIIVDGHHLDSAVVKTFFRAKGASRLILVSDAIWLAGLPPARYRFMDTEVELRPGGRVDLVGTPFLAGSTLRLCDAIDNVMRFAGASLADGVRMASENPARLLGVVHKRGRLVAGTRADLVILRQHGSGVQLSLTIAGGRVCYRA